MAIPTLPTIPNFMLNWGKRVSEGIKDQPENQPTGTPLTKEEEQQILDESEDDPLFTKEENALLRQAKKDAEEKRKKDEEDVAAATLYGEMMAERDPEKLKKNQEAGYQLDQEQEKIVWKYERDKPTTRKIGDFLSRAGSAVQEAAVDLPVGAYKGLKYTVIDPLTPISKDATEEEKRKVAEKAGQTVRSFGSGVVGGLEDLVYELPKTIYKGGTPVTDWAKELVGLQTEEESYQNYLNREAARKEFAAEEAAMPERTSALLAKGAGALGDVGLLDEQFSKDLSEQFKEQALTKDQMVPEVAKLGDIFAPDIPLMGRMSKVTGKATGKIGEGALKGITGVQVGNRRIGIAPTVEAVGYGGRRLGEKINEYSSKLDRALSGSDDWIFRNAVGKTSNFLGRGSGLIEGVGRFGTDIGRVLDTGMAGRKGVAERLGELPTQGRLANIFFGDASQAARKKLGELSPVEAATQAEKFAETAAVRSRQGLARARAVDSASRLAQYYTKSGINGAAVQVMLGLPNMETWGDVGEATGYGAGMGFVLGSNPKSLFVDRVRADQRKAAEADIGRMMETLDETTKARLKSLSDPASFVDQLTKRKDSVQSRVDLLKEIVSSAKKRTFGDVTITPRDAQAEIDHLEGVVLPKINSDINSAAKTNPQTQKEIEFIINKEFMDSLGNLKTVAEDSGLGGDVDVRMLGTDEIKAALDEMYKSQKDSAAEIIKTLGGQESLSPEDKKLLDDAVAFEGFLESEKENFSAQRGFALTPAKDRTQLGWWQSGSPVSKPTIIVNSDELKNSRGLDIASVLRHEMFHGLLQFGEVQDKMKEYTDILFDQYTTDEQGNQEKVSDGIISDEKLRQMADKYSANFNPLEKGMWRSMFETDADLLNAIKEEFLAEAFTQSGGATGMTSNVEDSVVESVLDYARAQSASSTLGKIRDSLGKMGISIDDSGRSNVLGAEIPSQAIALMRQFRRTLRDYNGTLNQIGQADLSATGSIPITKIASSKALFNRYKDADFWEREAATTITAPDGTVLGEQVLPKSAQNKLVAGEWVVKNGKLVPVDPEYTAKAPVALSKMAKGKPDGTKIVAGVRIARNADGTPRILSKAAVEAVARKRNSLIKAAIDTAVDDGTPNRLKDTGNGNYRGVMSPSQLMAISNIPDIVLPPKMKVLIRKINEMLLRGDGSRFNTEYQAALRGGNYRAMAPRFSDDVPIGFQFSQDGNFLVTTVSVTRLNNKLNAWAKEMPGRLALWNGSKYDFWADFVKVLDNQKKNVPGQTDLDADPQIAEEKKNVVNDLLNLYNKDTVDANPSRTKLKVKRGQDSRDRTIVSRRLDRMLRLDENTAEKLPINYGKVIANALPQAEFNFGEPTPGTKRFYQDFEILNKASGEYAGQPIRISVQAKTAEEADKLIRQTPDYQRYNSAYRFNSIGEPYSAPDPSERMTPEDFAEMKRNAGLGPSSKALPASIFGDFYHGTDDSNFVRRLSQGVSKFKPTLYGTWDPVEVIYVAPDVEYAYGFGPNVITTKLKSKNIFDPSSKKDIAKIEPQLSYSIFESDYNGPSIASDKERKRARLLADNTAKDWIKRLSKLGTNKTNGWESTEEIADVIKLAGFDGYIAWEDSQPMIAFYPDRVKSKFEKLEIPQGRVNLSKALPKSEDKIYYSARQPGTEQFEGSFFTPDKEAADQFGENFDLPVEKFKIEPKSTASEIDVEIAAYDLGIWKKGTPVDQYLVQGPDAIFEESKDVVRQLRKQGFDSVQLNDGMSELPSLVVLDPKIIAKALPKSKQDLSQVTLDERKAKLPKYRTRINFGGRQPYVAIYQDNDKGIEIGRAEYFIEQGNDDVVTMFIESSKVGEEYRNKGYGEALYRELAKLAQSEGVTRIEGLANKDAVKVREKLFERKPDPLGLDMNRIDMINPSIKYLPKSEQDFYSRLQRGIAASQQNTMSPEQAKSLAKKSTNQEELKWSGIEQAIETIAQENNGKVPKQALLDYMADAGNVQFEEVVLDEMERKKSPEAIIGEYSANDIYNTIMNWRQVEPEPHQDFDKDVEESKENKALMLAAAWTFARNLGISNNEFFDTSETAVENPKPDEFGKAKYGPKGMNKVIPGGENYREIVLMMPGKKASRPESLPEGWTLKHLKNREYGLDAPDGRRTRLSDNSPEEAMQQALGIIQNIQNNRGNEYSSSHYQNIPNYVAHMRVDDRKDAEGKEGRFIQEFQSDRHQQGRKRGYKGDETFDSFERWASRVGLNDETIKETWKTKDNRSGSLWYQFLQESGNKNAIPDAPFRKDWPLQMFKRALRDAVADGKEWIGWTDGATQADRYDLSQQVGAIIHSANGDGTFNIEVMTGESRPAISETRKTPDELEELVGKEIAQKIVESKGNVRGNPDNGEFILSKPDLKVGGEGMKGFYDTMLPKEIGKYVEKIGSKVEQSKLRIGEEYPDPVFDIPEGIQDEIAYKAEQRVRRANPALDDESSDFRDAVQELQYDLSEKWAEENGAKDYKIWRINITPEMATNVRKGQPKYLPYAPYNLPQEAQEIFEKAKAEARAAKSVTNLGFLIPATRRKFYETLGHSPETYDEVFALLHAHGLNPAQQAAADAKLSEYATNPESPVGRMLQDMADYEEEMLRSHQEGLNDRKTEAMAEFAQDWPEYGNKAAYDSWQEQWSTQEDWKWKSNPLKVYRRGFLDKPVQAWTKNSEGADVGQGTRLTPDSTMTVEELRAKGLRPVAGISVMVGSPGENEILFVKMPTPEMRKLILSEGQTKFLPKSEQQSNQPVQAPKERGLQFLKYAQEEEERPAPLSSLMMN